MITQGSIKMRVVLFGGKNRGSEVLYKLLALQEEVVGLFHFEEDPHEKVWYEKVQDISTLKGIPSFKHGSTSKSDATCILKSLKPEVIFVVSWRYMIPREQYSIPSKGCIVFHDSLLPKYRGFAPTNWAIINGEKKTGVTMFYIAEQVDAGDIIAQKAIDIDISDNAETLDRKITSLYIEVLEENLPLIAAGKSPRIPQDHSRATYACKRIPEDGLIDWTKPTRQIYNLIRGLVDPYPGAFTFVKAGADAGKLYIWSASLESERESYVGRIPGRVTEIVNGKGVKVLTGDGTLIVQDVQLGSSQTKRRADQIIRSIKTTLGAGVLLI